MSREKTIKLLEGFHGLFMEIYSKNQYYWNGGQDFNKVIEILKSDGADKPEPEQKLPICQICGKPRKVIAVLYEVHFDCKPKGGDK